VKQKVIPPTVNFPKTTTPVGSVKASKENHHEVQYVYDGEEWINLGKALKELSILQELFNEMAAKEIDRTRNKRREAIKIQKSKQIK